MPVVLADVVTSPLDLHAHLDAVDDARQGATATFVGRVRNHDPEVAGEVAHLDYSAHPSAATVIREIAERVVAEHDPEGVALVAVSHRIGRLEVGEDALVATVSAPHRALAFTVCSELVEDVKRSLPIWKLQRSVEGEEVWSGLP